MALQDLTPQLRTRLSRMERAVGWFVLLATASLAFGFAYYVYNTAERKGWFKIKTPYFTCVRQASLRFALCPIHPAGCWRRRSLIGRARTCCKQHGDL